MFLFIVSLYLPWLIFLLTFILKNFFLCDIFQGNIIFFLFIVNNLWFSIGKCFDLRQLCLNLLIFLFLLIFFDIVRYNIFLRNSIFLLNNFNFLWFRAGSVLSYFGLWSLCITLQIFFWIFVVNSVIFFNFFLRNILCFFIFSSLCLLIGNVFKFLLI